MRNNLTKKEISQIIYEKFGISLSFSKSFVDDFIYFVSEILKNEKKFNLKNFGSFKIIQKKDRVGRNPIDKKTHIIKARKAIIFKISNELKKKINNEQFFKDQ